MTVQSSAVGWNITIDGQPLDDDTHDALVLVEVVQSRHHPDSFVLEFEDSARALFDPVPAIDAPVEITLSTDAESEPTVLIDGELLAVDIELDGAGTRTLLRGYDRSRRLHRVRRTETYESADLAKIVDTVAARVGLSVGDVDGPGIEYAAISQHNQTDWEFLEELARRFGVDITVEGETLHLRAMPEAAGAPEEGDLESSEVLQLVHGANLLRLSGSMSGADQLGQVEVRGWDPMAKQEIVARTAVDTIAAQTAKAPKDLTGRFSKDAHVSVSRLVTEQKEAEAAAASIAERAGSGFVELHGVARGNGGLVAGAAVSLAHLGPPFDGKYTVTEARHVYDRRADGYRTEFSASGRHDRTLVGLLAGNERAVPRAAVQGVVPAVVSDNNDRDGGIGRVRVRFPWLSDSYQSDWIRVSQIGAGPGRGLSCLPEIDDEVLVAFEQGDMNRPVVIGGLHNGSDKPPLGLEEARSGAGDVHRRAFFSRKGHRMVFAEANDEDAIVIRTHDGSGEIRLDVSGRGIAIRAEGSLQLTAGGDLTLKAGGKVTVESGAAMKLQSATTLEAAASANTTIKGAIVELNP